MKALTNKLFIEVSEHFGTPTFLFNAEAIKEKYRHLRTLLTQKCDIFYSMKANPTLGICRYLKSLGSSCEVSSLNELLTALKAGFLAQQIIFVGPGKKYEEIEYCVQQKIKSIICESIEEIYTVNAISKKLKIVTSVIVRINPDFFVAKAPIKMSGVATQFGIEEKHLINQFELIKKCQFISLDGIQVYNASRVLDKNALCDNINCILQLAERLSKQFSIEWKTIDVGGGFGIPYFQNEKALCVNELINEINILFEQYLKLHTATKFIIELGRYLVAESGYLISTVQNIKTSHDKNYIIVDAGMHCNLAATGLGSFVHRNFPMRFIPLSAVENINNDEKKYYQVAGPLCTPGDVLLKDVELPAVKKGDLIVLLNTGAYGLSASPGKFLSHGFPSEVMHDNEKLYCIRRRETVEDIWLTQLMENNHVEH
ncbi:MAG: Orn/DAP/Arg decarboxylase 2 [uncultured bacterium]|nr:MAG: Orn/DAP/Arg decarboxylase 2 [uncultured bacterium]